MSTFKIISEDKEYETGEGKILSQPNSLFENYDDTLKSQIISKNIESFNTNAYIQSCPMIFSKSGHNMWFGDMYKGKSAFLILGGPSFKELLDSKDENGIPYTDLLKQPGFITASVNNAISSFRTDIWFSTDAPSQFIKSVWLDPKIMKFSPYTHCQTPIYDLDSDQFLEIESGDCPNSWFYKRNDRFTADTFLNESSFNWGNLKDYGGKRSIMLIAIKMLYYLGIRNIFLLGCDFYMDEKTTYHFDQKRHNSSISSNMATYAKLKERFEELKPLFDSKGFNIFNCNKLSTLKTFPYMSVDDAIDIALHKFPDVHNEKTDGLYDREYKQRQYKKAKSIHKTKQKNEVPIVSFCTSCMNRTDQLKETYIKNIEDCLVYSNEIEFVLLNYNSTDDLDGWVKENLMKYIDNGILNYYKTTVPEYWDMSHAKNVCHRLGQGSILCNLDADNFLGEGFYEFTKNNLYLNKDVFLRKRGNGAGGRLALHREHFYKVGGYDERMCYGWGLEDGDMNFRLENMGLKKIKPKEFDIVKHENKRRTSLAREKDFKVSRSKHSEIMTENIRNNVITVNVESGFGKTVVYKNFSDTPIILDDTNYDKKY